MNLTLEERERLAYIQGDTTTARLCGDLLDAEKAEVDAAIAGYKDGYEMGYYESTTREKDHDH